MRFLLCALGLAVLGCAAQDTQAENKTEFLKFSLFREGLEPLQLSASQQNIYEYIPGPEPQLLPASISHLTSSNVAHPIYALVFMEPPPQEQATAPAGGSDSQDAAGGRPKAASEGRTNVATQDKTEQELITHAHRRSPVCMGDFSWYDGCNWCSCGHGGLALCTRRFCRTRTPVSTRSCEGEGSVLLEDFCNWCSCGGDELNCTTNVCSPDEVISNRAAYYGSETINVTHPISRKTRAVASSLDNTDLSTPTEVMCTGRLTWFDGCNFCGCSDDGKHVCTRRACFEYAPLEVRTCNGRGSFMREDKCNWCDCVNGKHDCTSNTCSPVTGQAVQSAVPSPGAQDVPHSASRMGEALPEAFDNESMTDSKNGSGAITPYPMYYDCKPGSSFTTECNRCYCADSYLIFCTKVGCVLNNEDAKLRPPREGDCAAGAEWKEKCNWCTCEETGRHTCTTHDCTGYEDEVTEFLGYSPYLHLGPNETTVDYPECVPGSKFRVDCNWCTCSESGYKLCTRGVCRPGHPGIYDRSDEPECMDGPKFKDLENSSWCSCEQGKITCGYE